MATRTWSGAVDSDMNLPGNYSGSGALLPSDDLVFDAGSIAATASASLDVQSVTTTTGYSGDWSIVGFTLTVSGDITFGGPGTVNLGNGITLNGDTTTLHFTSTAGHVLPEYDTLCVLTINGNNSTFKTTTVTPLFLLAVVIGSGITTTFNGSRGFYVHAYTTTPLTIGNNSTLTLISNMVLVYRKSITAFSIGTGVTINGTGYFGNWISAVSEDDPITITIPALTLGGSITCTFDTVYNGNNCVWEFTGDLVVPGALQMSSPYTVGSAIYNFNDISLTCREFKYGSYSTQSVTYNMGSANIICNSFAPTAGYNSTYTTLNMETSTWVCKSNWTFASNYTVDPGTSEVTFSTNSGLITTNGKPFYDVVINGPGKTYTINEFVYAEGAYTYTAGTVIGHIFEIPTANIWIASIDSTWNIAGNWSLGTVPSATDEVIFMASYSNKNCTVDVSPSIAHLGSAGSYTGNLSFNGQTLTASGDIVLNGFGTLDLGNTITMTGATGSFIMGKEGTQVYTTTCALVMSGTTGMWIRSTLTTNVFYLGSLTLTTAAKVSMGVLGFLVLKGSTTVLTLADDTVWNGSLTLNATGAQEILSVGTGYSITGNLGIETYPGGPVYDVSVPDLTVTGAVTFSGYYGGTHSWAIGSITASNYISFVTYSSPSHPTFNLNGTYNCGYFYAQSAGGSAGDTMMTVNFGSSTINTGYVLAYTSSNVDVTLNYGSSVWNVGGSWTFGSNHIVDTGTSQVNFITNNANITCNGKAFYDVVCNQSTKTFTAMDNFSCHDFTLTAGNWTCAGYTMTASGDVAYGGTGTVTTGNIVMNGAGTTLSSTQDVTGYYDIVFNSTGHTYNLKVNGFIKTYTIANSASVTLSAAANVHISFTMGTNSTFTINELFNMWGSLNYSLGSGYTINGTAEMVVYVYTTGPVNLPSIVMSGASTQGFVLPAFYGTDCTLNQTGPISVPGRFYINGRNNTTLYTHNYPITCGAFIPQLGSSNYGTSDMTCASFKDYYNAPAVGDIIVHNMEKSNWSVGGNWEYSANTSVTHKWDKINFVQDAAITSRGNDVNWMSVTLGKTLTLNDDLQCRDIQLYGTLDTNSKKFGQTSDIIEVSYI